MLAWVAICLALTGYVVGAAFIATLLIRERATSRKVDFMNAQLRHPAGGSSELP